MNPEENWAANTAAPTVKEQLQIRLSNVKVITETPAIALAK